MLLAVTCAYQYAHCMLWSLREPAKRLLAEDFSAWHIAKVGLNAAVCGIQTLSRLTTFMQLELTLSTYSSDSAV